MSIFDRFWSPPKKVPSAPVVSAVPGAPVTATSPAQTVERRGGKRKNARHGIKALIIDDSPTVVAALRKVLRSAGYTTRDAGDAESGLAMVDQEKPDLIFLDIVLPGMNGFGALRQLRKDAATQHIPVIMISGNEHATEQFYAKRIGSDAFMKKPFSRFEVFANIEALFDEHRIPRRRRDPSVPPVAVPVLSQVVAAVAHPGGTAATAPTQAAAVPATVAPSVPAPLAPLAPTPAATPVPTAAPAPVWALLDARKQLTAMGLQYFNLEQFFAAIRRGDLVAVELFVASAGVSVEVPYAGETALGLAQRLGQPDMLSLLQRRNP